MADCRHHVLWIREGHTECRDCGFCERSRPLRFDRRVLSDEELRALVGDEMVDTSISTGRVIVAAIGPGPTITLDPEDS